MWAPAAAETDPSDRPHRAGAALSALERDFLEPALRTPAHAGAADRARCCASDASLGASDAAPHDVLWTGRSVDAVVLADGDRVLWTSAALLTRRDPDAAATLVPGNDGLWTVMGPSRPPRPSGGPPPLGALVCVRAGAVHGANAFVRDAAGVFRPIAAAAAGPSGPPPARLDDLRDATAVAEARNLILGVPDADVAAAPGDRICLVLGGTVASTAAAAVATSAANAEATVVGGAGAVGGAAARPASVLLAAGDGATVALLASATGPLRRFCLGPVPTPDALAPTTPDVAENHVLWVGGGGADPGIADLADVAAPVVVLADGAADAVLAAAPARRCLWLGPGCKRLFSELRSSTRDSVWFGGVLATDVGAGVDHSASVVVADGAGRAAFAARPGRAAAWFGTTARAVF